MRGVDQLIEFQNRDTTQNDTGRMKISDVHEPYYEQWGNSKGKPVVFLHVT